MFRSGQTVGGLRSRLGWVVLLAVIVFLMVAPGAANAAQVFAARGRPIVKMVDAKGRWIKPSSVLRKRTSTR
ncbi:MAG: hypothetical protein QOJ57_1381 [Thermoleophilaceae bacterium]|nr:hypothetical protein [Thermoleophilaceae bacterium]